MSCGNHKISVVIRLNCISMNIVNILKSKINMVCIKNIVVIPASPLEYNVLIFINFLNDLHANPLIRVVAQVSFVNIRPDALYDKPSPSARSAAFIVATLSWTH